MDKVVIIGSGGRENAIAKYIAFSERIKEIFVIPGNGGTHFLSKCININIDISKHESIVDFCKEKEVELVIVGPEEPLIKGLADDLKKNEIKCFGPNKLGAKLEASKSYGKEIMNACGIATALHETFSSAKDALEYLENAPDSMRVIKADGIAAGKGVIVADTLNEAKLAVSELLDIDNPKFGDQSTTIVIEELLSGYEISILAFTDGENIRCFPPSQDHKQAYDEDKGPNTGGMGAYCPCDLIDSKTCKLIEKEIVQKVIDYLSKIGITYQGILYVGLMMTKNGPYVLEFNCRFGDPETQVLLPILKSDLYEVMLACTTKGGLNSIDVQFHTDRYALAIVMVSGGYPGGYKKDVAISGLDTQKNANIDIIHAGTRYDEATKQFVTSGGRVLSVVAVFSQLKFSYNCAMSFIKYISFENCFYRRDIGMKAVTRSCTSVMTYAESGVSIEKGDELVSKIKDITTSGDAKNVAFGMKSAVMSQIGQFGAIFDISKCHFKDPLLITGTDGVGTKLKVAQQLNNHKTIGQDLVAMCVNDILCHGAKPMFFLDYYATGMLEPGVARDVIKGINSACVSCETVLIGGETAEMPSFYASGEYDLAGFVVGAVERENLLPRLSSIQEGNVLIGLSSSGLHSNGYSLARKIVEKEQIKMKGGDDMIDDTWIESNLLVPTHIYTNRLLPILYNPVFQPYIHSLTHVTGGGLPGNVSRSIPDHLSAHLDAKLWTIPNVFKWLFEHNKKDDAQDVSGIYDTNDFAKTFNLGVGMVIVADRQISQDLIKELALGDQTDGIICLGEIGRIVTKKFKTDYSIVIDNLQKALQQGYNQKVSGQGDIKLHFPKKRVAVLISGSGTNLEAILNYSNQNDCAYEVVLVISNKPGVRGLDIANQHGVPTQVVSHVGKEREAFDDEIDNVLHAANIELICLAGFMRILGEKFVEKKWPGRILNIHPSLLPSFKGPKPHKDALESGVRVTGATVHFVVADVDGGGIIAQAAIDVLLDDTVDTLSTRVKVQVEHRLYPRALDDVARNKCYLSQNNKVIWR